MSFPFGLSRDTITEDLIGFVFAGAAINGPLAGMALNLMHPMRPAERRRGSTFWAGGCPALKAGGSCPMKYEDFSHHRGETPGTPLFRLSGGGF